MSLSPAQAAAAHRLGQDVCVVAGPGSGKTRVLTERFCWLVTEKGIDPSRILAITFTEKAATQIKERLVGRFPENATIRERIERAYVSTIHAFCARLLRENAIAAAIDPEFQVLDEGVSAPLLRDVVDGVLDDFYRDEPERTRGFLRSLSVGTQRDGFVPDLAASLIDIYEALRISGTAASDLRREPPGYTEQLARVRGIATAIAGERVRATRPAQADEHAEAAEWTARIKDLPDPCAVADWLPALSRTKHWNMRSLLPDSAARRHETELRELCPELRSLMVIEHYASERALVADVLERVDITYRARKRAISGLDFSDLEEAAIGVLSASAALRERVQNSFDFILMDELQDTNPLQWKLMDLVRRPDNFFAVGDVNQSIYGFRHADPKLFHGYRDSLVQRRLTVDELRDNYRTRGAVLGGINEAFKSAGGVEPHTLISKGEDFAPKQVPSIDAIVMLAENSSDGREVEARWVARRIVELHGAVPVGKEGRPAKFGDMAILTRANQSTAELQEALDEFGIPSLVIGGLTFFETREVRDLKLLLDVLVNPRNEVSLAGLLRSPLIGWTDDDLLRVRTAHGSLSAGVCNEPPPYWSAIEELREIRNSVSPDRLLQRVIDERNYQHTLTGRARANIEKFLAALRRLYERHPGNLAAITSELEQSAPEAEAPPEHFGDAVLLMTVHKAKGLEFPIVFLPYLHKCGGNDYPVISYTVEYGLGIKWRDPNSNDSLSDAIRDRNKAMAKSAQEGEEHRLLYVAMSRAMEHLVLSWTSTSRMRADSWAARISGTLNLPDDPTETPVTTDSGVRLFVTAAEPEVLPAPAGESVQSGEEYLLDAATRDDLYESAVSATDVSRFVECPRKYYLSRYIKWDLSTRRIEIADEDDLPPARDDLDASELGTQVHELLAGKEIQQPDSEALKLAQRFRDSELGRAAERARTKRHEWDFVMAVHDVVVRGQIDLWFDDGRDIVVVDYKTDRVSTSIHPEDIVGYQLQLQLYAEALFRRIGRRPSRAVLHFLRTDTVVEVDVSPLACSYALDAIRQLRDAQEQLDFHVRKGEHCRHCDFAKGWCPQTSTAGAAFRD